MKENNKLKTRDIAYIGIFVAFIAISSWICIPTTVPITMQTLGIFTTVLVLGLKRGTLAVLVYIVLGGIGLPVFSGFSGGMGILFGANGGYIIGFLFSAIIIGSIIKFFGEKIWIMVIAMSAGLLACYSFGTAWFVYVYTQTTEPVGIVAALGWCVFPFIIPDILKIFLAVILKKRIGNAIM